MKSCLVHIGLWSSCQIVPLHDLLCYLILCIFNTVNPLNALLMAVTWLHVSDFHLSDCAPYDQVVILRALVESVKRFWEEGHVPDLIFATGDITQTGKAKEYESATNFFNDLLDAAGLKRDRLFIVPGNHDVDRSEGEFLARSISSEASADRYFSPDKSFPHLRYKFQAFSEWYNGYFNAIRSFPTNTTCSPVEILTINGSRLAVLPLNSALFCIGGDDHGQLFIGRRCLDEAKKQFAAADLTIALIHHPLDWLSPLEQANIDASLEASVDLLLQGHFHQIAAKGIVSDNGGYLKLAAGAAYQKREWPNSAMYVTCDCNRVAIFPIRYEDKPKEQWTLDTSVFASPEYVGNFSIPGRTNHTFHPTPAQLDKLHQPYRERYQATLKEELGYIRMLGMPGIESIKVSLNDNTFVPLRFYNRQGIAQFTSEKSDFLPDDIMKQVFHDHRGMRMLLVIGDPGAGKTTLIKYYALCAFDPVRASRLGFKFPVNVFYLPLRDLVRDKDGRFNDSLPANLAHWSGKHHQTLDAHFFDEWLQNGTALVLLDGLDEISNTEDRKEVCQWIDNAWSGFSNAYFVVTSRATGYRKDEGIELTADYDRADVQDFTPKQQERFLINWFTAAFMKEPCEKGFDEVTWQEKQQKVAEERTATIVAHLNVEKNKGLRQLAAIPMILQIMAILWKDREYIPESRVELYDAALNYLLEFRDKRRGIKPLLSAIHARQVLAPVSLWMQATLKKDEAARAEMRIEMQERLNTLNTPPTSEEFCDYLVKRAGLLVETGGKEYLFRHKSFREYLAGVQLKEDRPYDQLNKLVTHFGEDWWEETLRFFIASVNADVFDAFMQKLFDSPVTDEMTQNQQLLLHILIEEAPFKKVDALCKIILKPTTAAGRQRVILDCIKAINKSAAIDTLQKFSAKGLAKNNDIISRTEEVIYALGGKPLSLESKKSIRGKSVSYRNQNEQNVEYILIPGGSYLYSETEKDVYVNDLFVSKYPVTNKLYRAFINFLEEVESDNTTLSFAMFSETLNNIAKNKLWGQAFGEYFKKRNAFAKALYSLYDDGHFKKSDTLANGFKSLYDEDRKFNGEDQPVIGVSWYAAKAYCLWLSLLEGDTTHYRLPNEIEWEWFAGGNQQSELQKVRDYPWSEEKGVPTSILANYERNVGATTPVGRYPEGATPEGLYDIAGNVDEWTECLFDENTFAIYSLRGGSWYFKPNFLSCSSHCYTDDPELRDLSIGFRVVRSSPL